MTDFAGSTALVTGGGSGIGLRVVERLWAAGAAVVVADRDEAALDRLTAERGERIHPVVVDVTREDDIAAAVAVAHDLGGLRVGVNAAGIGEGGPVVDMELRTWQKVLDVCLTGVFLAVKHEARELLRVGGGGAIVNVASINANVPAHGATAYSVAKAGVEMLTRNAALELGPQGIRVTCVSPGLVATPMAARTGHLDPTVSARWTERTPMGRVGTTDDIAAAILFLAGAEATWITGTNLVIDGGISNSAYPVVDDVIRPEV